MTRRITTHLSKADPILGGVIAVVGPYRIETDLDCPPFQALARAITFQQLHGKAAASIFARFIANCGAGRFPTPAAVVATPVENMRACGLSFAKIASIKDLASKTLEGIVPTRRAIEKLDNEAIIERLTQVRGVGRWTVEMMLMFQLGRPDILPVDDFGVRYGFKLAYGLRTMPKPKALARYGEKWSPNRTAAAWYLWRACELAKAGALPAPAERTKLPVIRKKRRQRAPTS